MIVVLQRVLRARALVGGEEVAAIGRGSCVLACAVQGDGTVDALRLADKVVALRIFADAEGRTNLALADMGGAVLVVPQFTLAAETLKGRRPSFTRAAAPEAGRALLAVFIERVGAGGTPVVAGRFGAEMQLELVNDGPFTLVLDSRAGQPSS